MSTGPRPSDKRKRPAPTRCVQCASRTTRSIDAVCGLCRQQNPKRRREVKCATCGRRTTSIDGYCRECSHMPVAQEPRESHALTGGRWVNDRGIQRWVADDLWMKAG